MKCHSTPNVDDCSDYANGCRQHTWNQDHNHTGSREVLRQWKTGVLDSRVRAKPSVQPRRPAMGGREHGVQMMRSQRCLSTRLASALQKTKEAICPCQALLQRGGCVQRRPARWRHCCDGCAQLLHKSLLETDVGICGEHLGRCAGILLSTSSSASPPMTIPKLWSTAFPRKVRGLKSSSG